MSTEFDAIVDQATKLKRPTNWTVVLHNDNVTPMDFVVALLQEVFNMNLERSAGLMLTVHTQGSGVAGIYSYEIAEQKFIEAHTMIKLNSQQLVVSLEQE